MICGATGCTAPNHFLCDINGELCYLLFMVGYWSQQSTLWGINNECDKWEKSILKHLITVKSYWPVYLMFLGQFSLPWSVCCPTSSWVKNDFVQASSCLSFCPTEPSSLVDGLMEIWLIVGLTIIIIIKKSRHSHDCSRKTPGRHWVSNMH